MRKVMTVMTNKVKRSSGENPILDELRRHLSEPGPIPQTQGKLWAQRFQRLAEAIAAAPGLSCEECEAVLDLYVDDELRGRHVRRSYPLVWRHLQICTCCREAYNLLVDTLNRERQKELPPLPHRVAPRLSCLQPRLASAPWITHLRPRIAGAPFGLAFSFNLSYLRTLLSPPLPAAARTEEPFLSSATHLLLSDTIPIGPQTLAVEVTGTRRPERPDYLALQAIITGSAPLPAHLWATLTWAGQTRSGPVDAQGQVDLGEVSLATLQAALDTGKGDFQIAFEAREEQGNSGELGGTQGNSGGVSK